MKAYVDPEICIGCLLCAEICPEVYEMREDKAFAYAGDPVPEDFENAAKDVEEQCPVNAIVID